MDFSANNFSATYKVLVLGDSNVGKTCIVHRYCDERYYDTYISTIGEFFAEKPQCLLFPSMLFYDFFASGELTEKENFPHEEKNRGNRKNSFVVI